MVRKERKPITTELHGLVISMIQVEKHSFKEIAETLGLTAKTVRNIYNAYMSGEKFKESGIKKKETWTEKNSSFSVVDQTIFNSLSCNSSFVQKEISDVVFQKHNIRLSQPTISRKIGKINFTRKKLALVPVERNSEEKINARAIYANQMINIPDSNLIFLDETGFNEHTSRGYGYSSCNVKAYQNVPANKGVNRSLVCIIGSEGLITYSYRVGSYNSALFKNFLEEKLLPYFRAHPNKVLVMDNARIHKAETIQSFFASHNIPVKFLVPYSPQLNPIEEFFSMIKSRFKAKRINNQNLSLEEAM